MVGHLALQQRQHETGAPCDRGREWREGEVAGFLDSSIGPLPGFVRVAIDDNFRLSLRRHFMPGHLRVDPVGRGVDHYLQTSCPGLMAGCLSAFALLDNLYEEVFLARVDVDLSQQGRRPQIPCRTPRAELNRLQDMR